VPDVSEFPGHAVHSADPSVGENVPSSHAEHTLSFVAPDRAEKVPAAHSEQAADPGVPLNVPARHGEHAPPSSPVYLCGAQEM